MASPTNWYPMLRQRRRHWMLTDGTVITEPALEQSSSGRRVRVIGETKSHNSSSATSLAYAAALRTAHAKGQRIVCERMGDEGDVSPLAELAEAMHPPKIHVLQNPSHSGWRHTNEETTYRWHFQCVEMPGIDAVITASCSDKHSNHYGGSKQGALRKVATAIHTPRILPSTSYDPEAISKDLPEVPSTLSDLAFSNAGRPQLDRDLHEWMCTSTAQKEALLNTSFWALDVESETTKEYVNDDRQALRDLLQIVRRWDDVEEFFVPNYAKIAYPEVCADQPDVWTMRLVKTNATPEAIDALIAALDYGPLIEEALAAYRKMQSSFRSLGLVLADLRGADIVKLLAGQGEALLAQVGAVTYSADREIPEGATKQNLPPDSRHQIYLNLLSGCVAVECSSTPMEDYQLLNTAAAQWQEASAMASITGQETELLAYARAYARDRADKNMTTIRNLANR